MFEHKTYDNILQGMLDRVSDSVDKREGSIIYDALAPAALELAEAYSDLNIIYQLAFADTADGDHLTRRVAEHGVFRYEATFAVRSIVISNSGGGMHTNVPIGSLFALNDVAYEVIEQMEPGTYQAVAGIAGTVGNVDYGDLVPVEPVEDLGRAELMGVLIPGEDEESDEALYSRYIEHLNEQPFGGNRADYKLKVQAIDGVGGVRLFRTPNGGGTTSVLIINSDYGVPSPTLIDTVQEILDPVVNQGEGLGLAPIGHRVTVEGAAGSIVNVSTTLTLDGVTVGQIQPLIEERIQEYLLSLRMAWGVEESVTVVRISQIESNLLTVPGVVDIQNTRINGSVNNFTIVEHQIPVPGEVIIHEG